MNDNIFKIDFSSSSTEKKDLSFDSSVKEIPQWPVKNPTKFLGEFGHGDKRHQEALKALPKEQQNRVGGSHQGTDVGAEKGTPAYPMLSGIVNRIYNWEKGDPAKQGNMVVVDHPEYNALTKYMHLDSVSVSPGQKVDQNTQIGTVGNSGNAMGTYPHIHFELLINDSHVNARPYVEGNKEINKKAMNRNVRKKLLKRINKIAQKSWEDEDD